jgi:hypothetical protein
MGGYSFDCETQQRLAELVAHIKAVGAAGTVCFDAEAHARMIDRAMWPGGSLKWL